MSGIPHRLKHPLCSCSILKIVSENINANTRNAIKAPYNDNDDKLIWDWYKTDDKHISLFH